MRHRYPIGAFLKWQHPDTEGQFSNGASMTLRVLEQLASDGPHPMYLLNEGILADHHVIASEDELTERRTA